MAFLIYQVVGTTAERLRPTHLFGCHAGLIPHVLIRKYGASCDNTTHAFQWEITLHDIAAFLADSERVPNGTVVIDANPNDPKTLSLYRLHAVFGESSHERSVMMWIVEDLMTAGARNEARMHAVKISPKPTLLATFLYAAGDFSGGELRGTWNAPPRSSTNAPFMWPETMTYLIAKYRETQV